jgi:hypothetical protein
MRCNHPTHRMELMVWVSALCCLVVACSDTSANTDGGGPDGAVDVVDDLAEVASDAVDATDVVDVADTLDVQDEPDALSPMDMPLPGCIPGMSASCACTSGRMGAQVCQSDRTYGACVCMELMDVTPPGCVPGMSISCACTSGRMGAQVCQSDRTYGACTCSELPDASPVDVVLPPLGARLIAPQSVSRVTSRRPTMRWVLPDGVTRARVEVCGDRACTRVLVQQEVTGTSWRPTAMLAPGVTWWRVHGLEGDGGVAWTSATWEFVVGRRDAPVDTSFGTIKDFNGDGFDDIAIAENVSSGEFDIFSGRSSMGSSLPTLQLPFSGAETYEYVTGDFNGDGFADLAIARHGRGVVELRYGGSSGLPRTPSALISHTENNQFAAEVSSGDVNGDGYSDLVLRSGRSPSPPVIFEWQLFFGGGAGIESGTFLTIEPPDGYVYNTGDADVMEGVGDVNGDGYADILTSNPFRPGTGVYDVGVAWIVEGNSALPLHEWVRLAPPTSALGFGYGLAGVGDLNGDGIADFTVSSHDEVSIYLGATAAVQTTPIRTIRNSAGLCEGFPAIGRVVGRPGDYNGDGRADLTIGADCLPFPGPIGPRAGSLGTVFVYRGEGREVATEPIEFRGMYIGAGFGSGVGSAGDFNNDGFDDLIIVQGGFGWYFPDRPEEAPALNLLFGAESGVSPLGDWVFRSIWGTFWGVIAWSEAGSRRYRSV